MEECNRNIPTRILTEASTEGEAVCNGDERQVDARVRSQEIVQAPQSIRSSVLHFFLMLIRAGDNTATPQSVVICYNTPNLNQLQEGLMVIDVVLLISIHKGKVKCPLLLLLQCITLVVRNIGYVSSKT